MPGWAVILVILLVVMVDFVVIGAILAGCRAQWNPLRERHPPVDPAPDAVTKRFQSFKVGIINLGWSLHVSVDTSHLHLRPTRLARLIGVCATSVPWDDIHIERAKGRWWKAKVANLTMYGPAWCFELAQVDEPDSN